MVTAGDIYIAAMAQSRPDRELVALEMFGSLPEQGLFLCRFSDAGMTRLSTHCGGRRPKSAKARNRGKWGTGGAAGAMEI